MTDSEVIIVRAHSEIPFPVWVQDANLPQADQLEKASSVAFADPMRKLPITDAASTFLSAIKFFAEPEKYAGAETRLKQAAEAFAIADVIAPYAALELGELEKIASSTEGEYAIHMEDPAVKLLPLSDGPSTAYAASEVWKMASAGELPHFALKEAAQKITAAANRFNVEVLPAVVELATAHERHFTRWEKTAKLIANRHKRTHLDQEQAKVHYEGIVKSAAAGDITAEEAELQLAVADLHYGITPSYAMKSASIGPAYVHSPTELVYCGDNDKREIEKLATENFMFIDAMVPLSALETIPMNECRARMSKEAGEAVEHIFQSKDAAEITGFIDGLDVADRAVIAELLTR